MKHAIWILGLLSLSSPAFAGMQLGLSGAWAQHHLGLETHTMQMGKASLSVDLGSYFRIGYSFSQTSQHIEGYEDEAEDGEDPIYVAFEQDVLMNSHSVDLFAILYAGSIMTPYIFAGGAMKYFVLEKRKVGRTPKRETGEEPSPNFGAGLSISITKSFAMKIANTWSMGVKKTIDGEVGMARDSQFEVGISYSL